MSHIVSILRVREEYISILRLPIARRLKGVTMRVLITGGPTREYIDDVRFITNPSTGVMGLALAEEAAKRSHETTLVLGPTHLTPIYGVKVIPVTSSDEMIDRTLSELRHGYDLLISAAAIGDYAPAKRFKGKLSSKKAVTVRLKPTRKLIGEARKRFPKLRIIAFKAEYDRTPEGLVAAARRLLKSSDMVVANDVARDVFGSPETEAYIVTAQDVKHIPRTTKRETSRHIFDAAESMPGPDGGS
jgi:phosphopantothenoylcysteine decarboxylase / phosphopantothenate---cysteine ligase